MLAQPNCDTDAAVELHRILTACIARRFGLAEIVAGELAGEIALGIRNEVGGCALYIPAPDKKLRNQNILSEFRGNNYDELVRKYGLTRRHLERIIQSERAKKARSL